MEVRIEKQKDGTYIAYNVGVPGLVAIGTGESVREAKEDFNASLVELAEDMTDDERERLMTVPEFHFDISSLFEYFNVINVTAFARMIEMNAALLRQYKIGNTYISDKQLEKIEAGIRSLGKELESIRLI